MPPGKPPRVASSSVFPQLPGRWAWPLPSISTPLVRTSGSIHTPLPRNGRGMPFCVHGIGPLAVRESSARDAVRETDIEPCMSNAHQTADVVWTVKCGRVWL